MAVITAIIIIIFTKHRESLSFFISSCSSGLCVRGWRQGCWWLSAGSSRRRRTVTSAHSLQSNNNKLGGGIIAQVGIQSLALRHLNRETALWQTSTYLIHYRERAKLKHQIAPNLFRSLIKCGFNTGEHSGPSGDFHKDDPKKIRVTTHSLVAAPAMRRMWAGFWRCCWGLPYGDVTPPVGWHMASRSLILVLTYSSVLVAFTGLSPRVSALYCMFACAFWPPVGRWDFYAEKRDKTITCMHVVCSFISSTQYSK